MDLEIVVWCYIPILIGLLVIGGSVFLTAKSRNIIGLVASFLITTFNSLAIYILVQVVTGAYPTYIPHIFILVALILLVVQYFLKKKNKTFANN